jgi:phosphoglycerate dehydrogenase-like enzyme
LSAGNVRVRVHSILSDAAAYRVHAEKVMERLSDAARAAGRTLIVSESRSGELPQDLLDADVVVGFRIPTDRIDEFTKLRWIQLSSAGTDHLLPLNWLPRGVALTNSSGIHEDLAAEYAVCALLMLNFAMPRYFNAQRDHRWKQIIDTGSIRGKTVVLVGVGAIGGAIARSAAQLGMRVIGIRASGKPHRYVDKMFRPADLRAVMRSADFVVVTAPLTPETRHLVDKEALEALRPGAGLVCISRASVVDYTALADLLSAGRLRGAIVDVTNPEPLPADSPLWEVQNLFITPHISSDVPEYSERVIGVLEKNFQRFLAGRPLLNRVDRRLGY